MALASLLVLAVPAHAQSSASPSLWNPTLERKCAAKDAVACFTLGETLTAGRGVAADPVKAQAAFVRACDVGVAEGCYIVATRRSAAGDAAGAMAMYRKGCEAGLGEACMPAAMGLWKARSGTGDENEKLAVLYFDRGCTLRQADSCLYLSQIYSGNRRPYNGGTDIVASMRYAVAACNAGSGEACGLAGDRARNGHHGGRPDPVMAERYSKMSCNMGYGGGCMTLGLMATQRDDWTSARDFYARSCQLDRYPPSCKVVGDIDRYLADKSRYDAEMTRRTQRNQAGRAKVDQLLAAGNYGGAMDTAAYELGSTDQVNRVIVAAAAAGRMGDLNDIYMVAFDNWSLTGQARSLLTAENNRRIIAARRPAMLGSAANSRTWTSSGSSSFTNSVPAAQMPRISESDIYRNARENTRSTYCSAGWGCR
ncbi:hypothetical protein P1X14_13375 [Sphingomonas sp. AOB5]|uniref:tetratricopeptide repeat protein n=1 Tax=Sphingomonas sp. AOB5 TaxID=3034017 RepID=UPI0023F99CD9|nr:hypothetical protein [Sphingomonas sp. AOB5]MDF7776243.1 hypothetical protein [Sphingomonas sp. AOB5]